jgi:DNA polymerase-4
VQRIACFEIPLLSIACERARCPELTGAPLVVMVDGKIAVVSPEAVSRGVMVGQTISGARLLCPSLVVLPYDRDAYQSAARPIWDIYATESNTVEPVTPERCFVVMDGVDIPERAHQIADALAAVIGVPVRVGIASSKFTALHAAARAGDNGVMDVPRGCEQEALTGVRLVDIPGIPAATLSKLERLGLRTLQEAAAVAGRLPASLRTVSHRLQDLAMGRDGEAVRAMWPPPAIDARVPFEDATGDRTRLEGAIRRAADRAARRALTMRQYGKRVALVVEYEDSTRQTLAETLAFPTRDGDVLYRAGLRLLDRLQPGLPIGAITLTLSEMGVASGQQLALLDPSGADGLPHERANRLQTVLAYIRSKWGPRSVVRAGSYHQARRIGMWTYPLGHLLREPVRVITHVDGTPARYIRRRQPHDVRRVQNRWREKEWSWGEERDVSVWRVETSAGALSELAQTGEEWRLQGMAD